MRTLVAILALSPALLHAQAPMPAQPASTPVLNAGLLPPAAPLAAANSRPNTGRVSTGVTPARLIHSVNIEEKLGYSPFAHVSRTALVEFTVDAQGTPEDVRVVRASDPFTVQAVLEAVAQFRYQPATVSGLAVASPVNLQITVRPN